MISTFDENINYSNFKIFPQFAATFSRIAFGDSMNEIITSLISIILTVVSWCFRPADREIISVNQ